MVRPWIFACPGEHELGAMLKYIEEVVRQLVREELLRDAVRVLAA